MGGRRRADRRVVPELGDASQKADVPRREPPDPHAGHAHALRQPAEADTLVVGRRRALERPRAEAPVDLVGEEVRAARLANGDDARPLLRRRQCTGRIVREVHTYNLEVRRRVARLHKVVDVEARAALVHATLPEGHRAAGLLGARVERLVARRRADDAVARLQQRRVRQQDALLRGDLLEAVRLQAIRFPQQREHRGMALDFRVAQALLVPEAPRLGVHEREHIVQRNGLGVAAARRDLARELVLREIALEREGRRARECEAREVAAAKWHEREVAAPLQHGSGLPNTGGLLTYSTYAGVAAGCNGAKNPCSNHHLAHAP